MYLYTVLPSELPRHRFTAYSVRRLHSDLFEHFATLPLPFVRAEPTTSPAGNPTLPPFPPSLRNPTMEIASTHLVCSVALTGVLALQAGRWWAEQKDIDEDDDEDEDAPPVGAPAAQTSAAETKKSS